MFMLVIFMVRAPPMIILCGMAYSVNSRHQAWLVRPALGEGPHGPEVPRREAGRVREGTAQVGDQPVNHLGTPSFKGLPLGDLAADPPVEEDHPAVDGGSNWPPRPRRPTVPGPPGPGLGGPVGRPEPTGTVA